MLMQSAARTHISCSLEHCSQRRAPRNQQHQQPPGNHGTMAAGGPAQTCRFTSSGRMRPGGFWGLQSLRSTDLEKAGKGEPTQPWQGRSETEVLRGREAEVP